MPASKVAPHLRSALLLVILCFGVYGNVLNGEFVWDDQMQVVRNANIRTLDNIPRAFVSSLWSFIHAPGENDRDRASHQYYRPVQTILYILNYQAGGLSPFGYHLTNVALHAGATLFLYFLCFELGLPWVVSLLSAALFAVHPVHTEAVSWIAGVGDAACGLFYFGGLWAFLRHFNDRRLVWLWLASAFCLAALFSKEMAVTFPALAFLLIFLTRKKEKPGLKDALLAISPFVVVLVIYAVLRMIAVGSHLRSLAQTDAGIMDWATLLVLVVGQYLRYLLVPFPLYVYHLIPIHLHDRVTSTVIYASVLAALAIAAWTLRRRFSREFLCVGIFVIALGPVLYFPGISGGAFFAERYLYVPSMVFALIAGFLLVRLDPRTRIIAAGALAAIFSILTIQRNNDWNSEERLFARTLEIQPETPILSTSLGEIALRRGDDARAQEYFNMSMQHLDDKRFVQDPYETYRVYLGMGIAKARKSMIDEAIADLKKALDAYPQGDGAYATLGGILVGRQDYANATVLLEKAIQLSAVNELARDYLGVALVNQGRYEEAVKYFREALEINPELDTAKQHLQVALQAMNSSGTRH